MHTILDATIILNMDDYVKSKFYYQKDFDHAGMTVAKGRCPNQYDRYGQDQVEEFEIEHQEHYEMGLTVNGFEGRPSSQSSFESSWSYHLNAAPLNSTMTQFRRKRVDEYEC